MNAQKDGKTTAEAQGFQTYIQVESGIYRYKDLDGETTYHERPWIISRKGTPVRTYRALGHGFTRQTSLAAARIEYCWHRTEVQQGRNPYAEKLPPQRPLQQQPQPQQPPQPQPEKPKAEPAKLTVKEVVKLYAEKNYPDRYLRARAGRTLEGEASCCKRLLEYCGPAQPWDGLPWDSLKPELWDDYHDWRVEQINGTGDDEDDEDTDFEPKAAMCVWPRLICAVHSLNSARSPRWQNCWMRPERIFKQRKNPISWQGVRP